MSLRYLLDTNIVSAPFRKQPPVGLIRKLEEHAGDCTIAAVVWHELRFGCALLPPSKRRGALERYLDEVVLPNYVIKDYDRAAAEWHAAERARLTLVGRTPALLDGQIAAIARVNRLVLVTDNTADFQHFEGLDRENWIAGA